MSRNNPRLPALAVLTFVFCACSVGCKHFPPGGSIMEVIPIGSVLDQANRMQEENAEPAKFIVYMHEFELNKPLKVPKEIRNSRTMDHLVDGDVRGFRLSPYGQDHVKQIARQILSGNQQLVMVERSNTSKLRDTVYRYPVNYNAELDRQRRMVVVEALRMLGVEGAEQLVVVAPAYPEGLNSDEAAQAYQSTRFGGLNGGGLRGGGRGGFGGGIGGFGGGGIGGFGGGFGGGF